MELEDKAKVVASDWVAEFVYPSSMASEVRNCSNSVPPEAATTFFLSSVYSKTNAHKKSYPIFVKISNFVSLWSQGFKTVRMFSIAFFVNEIHFLILL